MDALIKHANDHRLPIIQKEMLNYWSVIQESLEGDASLFQYVRAFAISDERFWEERPSYYLWLYNAIKAWYTVKDNFEDGDSKDIKKKREELWKWWLRIVR